jgi:hypothetical protein
VTATPDAPDDAVSPAPRALRATVLLVALQGLGLVAIAGFYAVETLLGRSADVVGATVALGLALVGGVALLLVARGLRAGRRWTRSPALVAQLLAVPVALGLVQGGRWYVGLPVAVWAVAVIVLLFTPTVAEALQD